MKLFMFLVGGGVPASNVELHDIRFAVGETAEACWPDLRRQWWGDPATLHLDCWGAVEQIDGFDVILDRSPDMMDRKLFFVHLGGYDFAQFNELHENILIVAADQAAAVRAALARAGAWSLPHKDKAFEVDRVFDVGGRLENGLHLHLRPSSEHRPFRFQCDYVPIGTAAV